MFLLGLIAIALILGLQSRAAADRAAQLRLSTLRTELSQLQGAPLQGSAATGGSPEIARELMRKGKASVAQTLSTLRRGARVPALDGVAEPLAADYSVLDALLAVGNSADASNFNKSAARASKLVGAATIQMARVDSALGAASVQYDRRASAADRLAGAGAAASVVLLLLAFAFAYGRSVRAHAVADEARSVAERLSRDNADLAAASHEEARTDALTGLRNRRALIDDLAAQAGVAREHVLALFDLDGFKQYNDTFGHPAGDALLARLGDRLKTALGGAGTAYRMGGDEFCVLMPAGSLDDRSVRLAAEALSETGDAFSIGCSFGAARLSAEAPSVEEALRVADQRMYENKATGRASASRQSSDVLLKVLSERNAKLREHVGGVSRLAGLTAERLGLPANEVKRISLAAELHDVGKTAIPDDILDKPGPLDPREWEFMRRHTLIGERILLAAPSLAPTADLVRSSHERFDGTGYPDALSGARIPIGASIIAVCDAFDAMVSERPYRPSIPTEQALAELHRCAGGQFHPAVVGTFCQLVAEGQLAPQAA